MIDLPAKALVETMPEVHILIRSPSAIEATWFRNPSRIHHGGCQPCNNCGAFGNSCLALRPACDHCALKRYARKSRRERVEPHRFEKLIVQQLVVPGTGCDLSSFELGRTTKQLLEGLWNDHGRLRRSANDHAHNRRSYLAVGEPRLSSLLALQAPSENIIAEAAQLLPAGDFMIHTRS
jgi:hypothetical protein